IHGVARGRPAAGSGRSSCISARPARWPGGPSGRTAENPRGIMTRMTTPLVYSLEGNIAVLHMDDGKANALSPAMIGALGEGLDRAEKEAAAAVLVGRPERFSAGFDLKIMMSGPEAAGTLLRAGADMLMRFYGASLPLVIACTGHALAGGALLL